MLVHKCNFLQLSLTINAIFSSFWRNKNLPYSSLINSHLACDTTIQKQMRCLFAKNAFSRVSQGNKLLLLHCVNAAFVRIFICIYGRDEPAFSDRYFVLLLNVIYSL